MSLLGSVVTDVFAGFYQANVARNNAKILDTQADRSLQTGQYEESMSRIKSGKQLASATAEQGASGFDLTSGTAKSVRGGIAASGELDALAIRYNSAREAYGYRVDASNKRAEASADILNGFATANKDATQTFLAIASALG